MRSLVLSMLLVASTALFAQEETAEAEVATSTDVAVDVAVDTGIGADVTGADATAEASQE